MPLGGDTTLGGRRTGFDIPTRFQNPDDPTQVLDFNQNQAGFGPRSRRKKSFVDPAELEEGLLKKKGIRKILMGAPPKLRSILSGGGASPSSVLGG